MLIRPIPRIGGTIVPIAAALLLLVPVAESRVMVKTKTLPTTPPPGYQLVVQCNPQFGQLWAPPTSSEPNRSSEPPMMGFYDNHLTAMIFYLSEAHLYPRLPGGGLYGFAREINASITSVTIAPAQYRPQRDRRGYELTVMIHHDPPVTVTCSSTKTPTGSQDNSLHQDRPGDTDPNQGGGSTPGSHSSGSRKPK